MRKKKVSFTTAAAVCAAFYFFTNLVLHLLGHQYGWSLWGQPFRAWEAAASAALFGLCFAAIQHLRASRQRLDQAE